MTRMMRTLLAAAAAAVIAPAGAFAGWKEDIGTLRIGMVAKEGSGAAIAGATLIERAFANALGMPVAIFVARDYAALIDAQASSRVEYAVYSASAYAVASQLCDCVEPIAAPIGEDGTSGLRSVLIMRKGSGLPPGKGRIAVTAPDDVAGYMAPLASFRPGGAAFTGSEANVVHAGGAAEAEALFARGEVDGFFGWVPDRAVGGPALDGGTVARLRALGIAAERIDLVWMSEPLRFGPHAVRKTMPDDMKDTLRGFLTGLKLSDPDVFEFVEPERQGGFVRVSAADYDPAIGMVRLAAGNPPSR